jgi:uncharacterized protein YndB with AHSA1/START domain
MAKTAPKAKPKPKSKGVDDRELVITRIIDAPPEAVFRAWTEPKLLKQWFAPRPWTTPRVAMDVRTGGSSLIVMRSPEGKEQPCPGVFLEVIPNEKIVFTDAYTSAWVPSGKPFMTGIVTFENVRGKTRYTTRVRHWSTADRETHEKMGFHEGWGICTDQLAEIASKL